MFTLAISFFLSLLIAFFVVIFNFPGMPFGNWGRIILFALLTLFYISIFLILGLIISSLTKKSSVSLIFCLFVWIFLIIIIPNLSTYLSTVLKSVPPEKTVRAGITEITEQTKEKIKVWEKNNPARYSISGSFDTENGIYELVMADKGSVDYFKKRISFEEPLLKQRTDDAWEVKQDYYRQLKKQENLAVYLNRISPLGLYQETAEMISRTDTKNYERFIRQSVLYFESIYNYLESKDAFNSLRFFTVMEEKNILPREEYKKVNSQWSHNMSDYPALNLSDFPRFEYQEEGLAETFSKIIVLLIVFVLFNIILFMVSVFALNYYDVR
jgi:ABC-type transport system involved in multi-copper enzyme maturation permease subunit